jgi:hypothetical protein
MNSCAASSGLDPLRLEQQRKTLWNPLPERLDAYPQRPASFYPYLFNRLHPACAQPRIHAQRKMGGRSEALQPLDL